MPKPSRTCSIPGCEGKHSGKGFCKSHYDKWRLYGDPLWEPDRPTECSVDGCHGKPDARGMCAMHYGRWRNHGDPLGGGPRRGRPVADRFWDLVEKNWDTGCWLWTGTRTTYKREGYGRFNGPDGLVLAHRFAYELLVGPIPEGLQIDHLCRVRLCVNPAHLEPVTHTENVLRGTGPTAINARKTHCNLGHEFTPENTGQNTNGGRLCLKCSSTEKARRSSRWACPTSSTTG